MKHYSIYDLNQYSDRLLITLLKAVIGTHQALFAPLLAKSQNGIETLK